MHRNIVFAYLFMRISYVDMLCVIYIRRNVAERKKPAGIKLVKLVMAISKLITDQQLETSGRRDFTC
jgi:hypothetical protein